MAEHAKWHEISQLVREVGHERWISTRLAEWRQEADNMTQADLAKRMTELGYPMNKTSVWKIENPDKKAGRRAISIGEAIGFARVFQKPLDELLLPPGALANLEGWQGYIEAVEQVEVSTRAWSKYRLAVERVRERVAASPELRAQLESELELVIEARMSWITQFTRSALEQFGCSTHEELARSTHLDSYSYKAIRDLLGDGPIEHFGNHQHEELIDV